jgi:hypothetical protein
LKLLSPGETGTAVTSADTAGEETGLVTCGAAGFVVCEFASNVGEQHFEQGVYPAATASASEIAVFELFRYEHPALWYLVPVLVIYTVVLPLAAVAVPLIDIVMQSRREMLTNKLTAFFIIQPSFQSCLY